MQALLNSHAARTIAIAATTVFGMVLASETWWRWGDLVIDLGRELEVAAKLASGDVLYRDVAYNYGPLAPYANAALILVLGPNVGTFVVSGFLATVACCILLHRVAARYVGEVFAHAAVWLFLAECVFQHTFYNGVFNWILPYSYPATSSTVLAIGAVAAATHDGRLTRRRWITAGVLLGLSGLGKIEVAAAGAVGLFTASAMTRTRVWVHPKAALLGTLSWSAPTAAVVLIGFTPFVLSSSFEEVFDRNVLRRELIDVSSNVFFMRQLGLENGWDSLARSMASVGVWLTIVVACSCAVRQLPRSGALAATLGGAVVFAAMTGYLDVLRYDSVFRLLPWVAGAIAAWGLLRPSNSTIPPGLVCFAVFAFACFARILFNAGPQQYGFFLAVPGFAVLIIGLGRVVPHLATRTEEHRATLAIALLAFPVCIGVRDFVSATRPKVTAKTLRLSGPGGSLYAHPNRPRYQAIASALEYLGEAAAPDTTLLVIPEGAGVNFLTGLRNPTAYNLFTPPELNAPDVEDRLCAQIEAERVDRILLVDRNVQEYGYRGPGIDYGEKLIELVMRDYRPERRFGRGPFSGPSESGAILFRRKRPR